MIQKNPFRVFFYLRLQRAVSLAAKFFNQICGTSIKRTEQIQKKYPNKTIQKPETSEQKDLTIDFCADQDAYSGSPYQEVRYILYKKKFSGQFRSGRLKKNYSQ